MSLKYIGNNIKIFLLESYIEDPQYYYYRILFYTSNIYIKDRGLLTL